MITLGNRAHDLQLPCLLLFFRKPAQLFNGAIRSTGQSTPALFGSYFMDWVLSAFNVMFGARRIQ